MSNQFSYELDERQIRLLMLNSESDYNEAAWQRFESTIGNTCKPGVKASLPKLNFSISRSFIIPVLFIGLIGGLSTLLFSFVDIKKKEEVLVEKPLQISKPVVKPTLPTTKPAVKAKATVVVSTPVISVPENKTLPVATETKDAKVVIEPSAKDIKAIELSKKTEPSLAQNPNTTSAKTKTNETKPKKKRKRMEVEELPTITAPTNLSSGIEEPELDLK